MGDLFGIPIPALLGQLLLGLVVLGLLPQMDSVSAGLKLLCIWGLVLLSGATASQLIARARLRRDTLP